MPEQKEDNFASDNRSQRIDRIVAQVLGAAGLGKPIDYEAFKAGNSELMPELGEELEKIRRIEAARRSAAEMTSDSENAGSNSGTGVVELETPAIEIPGYSIERELGRGGQGVVYLARRLSTGRQFAVKVLREGVLADSRTLARFDREAKVLASLNHPHIVAIIDLSKTADGKPYIVMDYIAGWRLDEYITLRLKKDPDPSRLLRLFLRICAAVNAAHRQGIIHRDLKPANIRIDERGAPHLLDFGLARSAADSFQVDPEHPISVAGEFLGSLPWCSPEQAMGDPEKIDVRTDVYSLGVILYQLLTGGRFPYAVAGNIRDVMNNILNQEPTPPSKVVAAAAAAELRKNSDVPTALPAVNEAIERIVLKALAKDPNKRYANAGNFGKDIAEYLAGQPTAATRRPKGTPLRRMRMTWLLPAACTLIVWVAAIVVHHIHDRAGQAPSVRSSARISTAPASPELPTTRPLLDVALTPHSQTRPTNGSRHVDLLKLVNPATDTIVGNWTLDSAGLHSSGIEGETIEFPYSPPTEYDYRIVFVRTKGVQALRMVCYMVGHDSQFMWIMSTAKNEMEFSSASENDNPSNSENSSVVTGKLSNDVEHVCLVAVRQGRVQAYLDGKLVCTQNISHQGLSIAANFPRHLRNKQALGLDFLRNVAVIKSAEVIEVTGEGTLLRAPAANVMQRRIDLLKLVDPVRDSVEGDWTFTNGALVGRPSRRATIEFPYSPPKEYDYRVVFNRASGVQTVALVCAGGGHSFVWAIGGMRNMVSGFGWVDGRNANFNESSRRADQWITNGQTYTTVVKVRADGVRAYLDDKLITELKTDYSNLKSAEIDALHDNGVLGLSCISSQVTMTSAEVIEITGQGQMLRRPGSPPASPGPTTTGSVERKD